jgi:transcriptional regulator with XRE-family HTH domain
MTVTFGKHIRRRRMELGISQRELASRIKKENGFAISPQYLNDLELGRRYPPAQHLIEQFVRELQLDRDTWLDYFLFLANDYPEDVKEGVESPDQFAAAMQAFRRVIKKE